MSAPIVVTGGTGLVGGRLLPILRSAEIPIRLLTRRPGTRTSAAGVERCGWNGIAPDAEVLEGARAVVHLSGEPLFGGVPTPARRRRIRASRVDSTRAIVSALGRLPAAARPAVLVCASAVGIYGDRGDVPLPESAAPGEGFLSDLCVAWEAEALRATELGVRCVSLRFGIVLAREGGALALLARVFRAGLGGRIGHGRQWMPWIHVDDAVGAIGLALETPAVTGPVNAVAPQPVRNGELTRILARTLHRPALLPVPRVAVRAALGPLASELLDSRRVLPARLEEAGYAFRYPALGAALATELCSGAPPAGS